MNITTAQIAKLVSGKLEGDPSLIISGPSSIEDGQEGTINFLSNEKYQSYIYKTRASAIIIPQDLQLDKEIVPAIIRVENVGKSVETLLSFIAQNKNGVKIGISEQAFIDPTAMIGDQVFIDRFSLISEQATIGKGTQIMSQVYIGNQVQIGNYVKIYPGVKIYNGSIIGDHTIIHSNAVIGSDGFGYNRDQSGAYSKIPHLGKVVIEQNVEIGANTVIDRGTLGDTVIKSGVKLDNLIQIAHNVQVGENTAIAAQAGIAGSTQIKENCIIGGQAGLAGHITIDKGTMIQAQSGVASSIKKENTKWYGSPALDYTNYLKSYAYFKNLSKMNEDLKSLRKEIDLLRNKIND